MNISSVSELNRNSGVSTEMIMGNLGFLHAMEIFFSFFLNADVLMKRKVVLKYDNTNKTVSLGSNNRLVLI